MQVLSTGSQGYGAYFIRILAFFVAPSGIIAYNLTIISRETLKKKINYHVFV